MNETLNTIRIGNYRISRADERNLQIDEFRLVKAKRGKYVKEARETEKWVCKGYFSDPVSACSAILRYMTEDGIDQSEDIPALIEAIAVATDTITQSVQKAGLTLDSFEKEPDGRGRKKAVV